MDALMPSATLASTGDGATVPIHTTMAQPLLFSNSGRNVEPIRRRMARRGMRVASEAYTVPMQQPMPRLNKELGHKVVDKERYGYGCLCGCACEKMDGTKEPKAHDRASSVACASVHKSHVLPLVSLFVLSVTFFLLLVGLCTRVVSDYACASLINHPQSEPSISIIRSDKRNECHSRH